MCSATGQWQLTSSMTTSGQSMPTQSLLFLSAIFFLVFLAVNVTGYFRVLDLLHLCPPTRKLKASYLCFSALGILCLLSTAKYARCFISCVSIPNKLHLCSQLAFYPYSVPIITALFYCFCFGSSAFWCWNTCRPRSTIVFA